MQTADSFSAKLPYFQQKLLHSQHLVSALKSCTPSFQQSTLSIMQGKILLSAHSMLRVLRVNDFADVPQNPSKTVKSLKTQKKVLSLELFLS